MCTMYLLHSSCLVIIYTRIAHHLKVLSIGLKNVQNKPTLKKKSHEINMQTCTVKKNVSFDTIKNDITCLWDATTFQFEKTKKSVINALKSLFGLDICFERRKTIFLFHVYTSIYYI